MKILKAGARSIYDDSQWVPGVWREEPTAPRDGQACRVGLHSLLGNEPRCSPVFRFPVEVWSDECEDECGRDHIKARFRRQRVVENITNRFPQLVAVNRFITETIPAVRWFEPELTKTGKPCQRHWMRVERYGSTEAAGYAARTAARTAAGDAARNAAWAAARNATRDAAWGAAGGAAGDAAWAAVEDAAWGAAGAAAWAAAWDAEGKAQALLAGDLDIDNTWLHRWWEAWAMGFYPIREEGDRLVVGWVTDAKDQNAG